MKPRKQEQIPQQDLFRLRPDQMLDQRHALYQLADKIEWHRQRQSKQEVLVWDALNALLCGADHKLRKILRQRVFCAPKSGDCYGNSCSSKMQMCFS